MDKIICESIFVYFEDFFLGVNTYKLMSQVRVFLTERKRGRSDDSILC